MTKPRIKIGMVTRLKYQALSDDEKKVYEDLAAKHGYEMSDLYQIDIRRKRVLFWVFDRDKKGHILGRQVKEYPR